MICRDLRVGLDATERINISCPYRESKPGRPASSVDTIMIHPGFEHKLEISLKQGRQVARLGWRIKNLHNSGVWIPWQKLSGAWNTYKYNIHNSDPTLKKTHFFSVTNTNQLMLFTQIIDVYWKNNRRNINTPSGQNTGSFNVEARWVHNCHTALKGHNRSYVIKQWTGFIFIGWPHWQELDCRSGHPCSSAAAWGQGKMHTARPPAG
jgi:hypothetical protein